MLRSAQSTSVQNSPRGSQEGVRSEVRRDAKPLELDIDFVLVPWGPHHGGEQTYTFAGLDVHPPIADEGASP